MIYFGFRVFDVNWLFGTLRKGIQSLCILLTQVSALEKQKELYIYIYIYICIATYSC